MIAQRLRTLGALLGAALFIITLGAPRLLAQKGKKGGKGDAPALVVVGGESVDFGTVKSGYHRKIVTLTNSGTDTLRLLGALNTDCGCVAAETSASYIAPGDSAQVEVTLLVGGSSQSGTKRFTIATNDPVRPEVTVTLKMNIVNDLAIKPATFLVTPSQSGAIATVVIRNTSDLPLTIGAPTLADTGAMQVTIDANETKLLPGEELKVDVLVKTPTNAVAPGYALFRTSSSAQPEVRVYFVGKE
jgi:hypothetical protein